MRIILSRINNMDSYMPEYWRVALVNPETKAEWIQTFTKYTDALTEYDRLKNTGGEINMYESILKIEDI